MQESHAQEMVMAMQDQHHSLQSIPITDRCVSASMVLLGLDRTIRKAHEGEWPLVLLMICAPCFVIYIVHAAFSYTVLPLLHIRCEVEVDLWNLLSRLSSFLLHPYIIYSKPCYNINLAARLLLRSYSSQTLGLPPQQVGALVLGVGAFVLGQKLRGEEIS